MDQHKGIWIALGCAFIFALRLCIIKSTPIEKAETLLFYRFLFDFLLLAPFFYKHRKSLKTSKLGTYTWRSVLVAISIFSSTYGVQHLALADAVLLQYTFPLFVSLVLWIFYKKKISMGANMALWIGFAAVFFLLNSKGDIFHLASFASLTAAVAAALLAISLHELVKTEHILAILFYCTWIPGCMSFIPFYFSWEPVPLSIIALYCIPSSFLGVIYQYFMAKAYSYAPPHIVGSFSYFCVFFSTLLGWVVWNESLSLFQAVGGILIVLCGILMIRENSRIGNQALQSSNNVE
ncbi:MAG: DMT family transporter [Verrucomicrobia bacterium]|nr:DMT family transporter [Verrucomicrobiota bacterium]